MKIQDSEKHILNLAFAKFIGLYQMLDTETVTFLGCHNVLYKMFVDLKFKYYRIEVHT